MACPVYSKSQAFFHAQESGKITHCAPALVALLKQIPKRGSATKRGGTVFITTSKGQGS